VQRYTKKIRKDWVFFTRPRTGRIAYNKKCLRCIHDCKQSYRTQVIVCFNYEKSIEAHNKQTYSKT